MIHFTCALLGLTLVSALADPKPDYPPIVTKKKLYAKNDLRGKKAPELVVERWLNGMEPSLKDKIVFVDFWATWCPPCRELIPEVNAFHAKYGKDVAFIGLSKEDPKVVEEFMAKTKMNYPIAIDTKGRTSEVLGVEGIPHVMVVTPDGIVRWQGFPGSAEDPMNEKVLVRIIDAWKASKGGR